MKTVKRGYAAIRVSTDKQDISGGSLEQQINRIKRWAAYQGEQENCTFDIIKVFEEKTSGKFSNTKNRKILIQIKKAVEAGLIDFVLIEKVDRLSRDAVFLLEFARHLHKYGCDYYEVDSGKVNLNDRGSKFSYSMKSMAAEDFSSDLSEKMSKKTRESKVNSGKDNSTKPCLGLDPTPGRPGIYKINQAEQVTAIDIYKRFIKLESVKATLDYCNSNDYKSKKKFIKERYNSEGEFFPARELEGKPFTSNSLIRFLQSEKIRAKGAFEDNWDQFKSNRDDKRVVDWNYSHPPVVSKDLTDQVDSIFLSNKDLRKRFKKRVYLLSGILFANDGSRFSGEAAKSGSVIYYTNHKHSLRIKKEDIEAKVFEKLRSYMSSSETISSMFKQVLKDKNLGMPLNEEDIITTELHIRELNEKLSAVSNTLRKVIVAGGEDIVEVCNMIKKERDLLENEITSLKSKLQGFQDKKRYLLNEFNNHTLESYLNESFRNIKKKSDLEIRGIIQKIFKAIVIDPKSLSKVEIWVRPDPKGYQKNTTVGSGANVRLSLKWGG